MINNTILKAALTSVALLNLVACQPKKDEASVNVSGNISASEQTVTSNSGLGGQPVNLLISMENQLLINGGWGYQTPTINMNVAINRTVVQLPMIPTMMTNEGTFVDNLQMSYVGNFQVRNQAICEGMSCESVFINLIITPSFGFPEAKQIGIYFSRINRRVLSAMEFTGGSQQVMSGISLINNLRSLAQ